MSGLHTAYLMMKLCIKDSEQKKQSEINQIKDQMLDSENEISNLEFYLQRSIEISQNIHNYWQLGSLEDKRKIQKLVFPEGIVVDTKKRTYLTSKVNSLFLAKSQYKVDSGGTNIKLPIKSDEESSLVDYTIEISNLDLVMSIFDIQNLLEYLSKYSLSK